MHTLRRTATAVLVAVALVVVAGLGVFRQLRADARGPVPSTSALDAPIVPTASLDQTIADLQAHLAAAPDDAHSYAELGLAYSSQATHTGDPTYYPKAEEALQRSLTIQPDDNADALIGMGVVANAKHDFADGVRWGRQALAIEPDAAHILGVIGDGQLELGHYPQAFATFSRMVRMRPDIASYARVSYARELQGNTSGALAAMHRALLAAGSPDDAAWVSYQLGGLYLRTARVGRAAHVFRQSEALSPTYVPPHAGLARVAWERGDLGAAIRGYRWVVARLPLPEYVIALGDLYTMAGRAAAGRRRLRPRRHRGHPVPRERGQRRCRARAVRGRSRRSGSCARGREGRVGGAPQHQRRRRARMGLVPIGPLPVGRTLRTVGAAPRHAGRPLPLPRGDDRAPSRRAGRGAAEPRRPRSTTDPHFSILYASSARRTLDRLTRGAAT